MFHFYEAITNTSGDSLAGYYARVLDTSTGEAIPLFSDNSGTPIITVSGVADMAVTDSAGNLSFYLDPGTYNVDLYAPDAVSFIKRIPNVGMTSTQGIQGPAGPMGSAGNVASTLADIKAADIANDTLIYDHATFKWTTGDYTGQADDTNTIESDDNALTVGAWIRQKAVSIQAADGNNLQQNIDHGGYIAIGETDAVQRTGAAKFSDIVSVKDFWLAVDADWTNAFQRAVNTGKTVLVPFLASGYPISGSIVAPGDLRMRFEDGAYIDVQDGTYESGYALSAAGSSTAISDLSTDVAAGATSLSLATAADLGFDDVFQIYNPTDASWSGFRTYYNAGEFCRVISSSGTTVNLQAPLYDDYAASAVNLYKITPIGVDLVNVRMVQGAAITGLVGLVSIQYARDPSITNMNLKAVVDQALSINRCIGGGAFNCYIKNQGVGLDDYGISLSNCQDLTVRGGSFYSRRHGTMTGGDDQLGNTPCRNIVFVEAEISNDPASGTHAADMHGNGEFNSYKKCKIRGGLSLQGANVTADDNDLFGGMSIGTAIYAAEVLGGIHRITNNRITVLIDPQTNSRGIIDYGGNSPAINANSTRDLTLIIKGNSINSTALSSVTGAIKVVNNGTSQKINVTAERNTLTVNALSQMLSVTLASGTAASDFLIVDHNDTTITGAYSIYPDGNYSALPKLRCQGHKWTNSVTLSTSSSTQAGTAETFPWKFPRNPAVTAGKAGAAYAGNRVGIVVATAVSTIAATLTIATDDATHFSSAATVTLNGEAAIREV